MFDNALPGEVVESSQLCQDEALHSYGHQGLGYSRLDYTQLVAASADDRVADFEGKSILLSLRCLLEKLRFEEVEMRCGFVLDDGSEQVSACAIVDGEVHVELETGAVMPVAFVIDVAESAGPVLIDDVQLSAR